MIDLEIKDVEPCGYSILVELHEVHSNKNDKGEAMSAGGILLAQDTARKEQESVQIAKVVKIGPYAYKKLQCGADGSEDWGVKVGDYVLFDSYCGRKVTPSKDDNRRLLTDQEIRAKVTL